MSFIPERFDPSSKYYLTPKGTKRHPMSYGPFLGGKRVCLGKTFAVNIAKCMVPVIICSLDFKFDDPIHYQKKPNNLFIIQEPKIIVKVSKNTLSL